MMAIHDRRQLVRECFFLVREVFESADEADVIEGLCHYLVVSLSMLTLQAASLLQYPDRSTERYKGWIFGLLADVYRKVRDGAGSVRLGMEDGMAGHADDLQWDDYRDCWRLWRQQVEAKVFPPVAPSDFLIAGKGADRNGTGTLDAPC